METGPEFSFDMVNSHCIDSWDLIPDDVQEVIKKVALDHHILEEKLMRSGIQMSSRRKIRDHLKTKEAAQLNGKMISQIDTLSNGAYRIVFLTINNEMQQIIGQKCYHSDKDALIAKLLAAEENFCQAIKEFRSIQNSIHELEGFIYWKWII